MLKNVNFPRINKVDLQSKLSDKINCFLFQMVLEIKKSNVVRYQMLN